MPDASDTKPDDIAPLLRIGLADANSAAQTLDATIRVGAPTPRTGGSGGAHGWNPPSVEELQKMLPQYEISAFIARGGMGAVYKGTQKTLKRPVAIKVLPPEIEDGDAQFAARFKHEAQAMAQLSHPNIVAVFDAGETPDGLLYFVMEFIEGTDVARLIASEGQLDPLRAIQITTSVCEALAFAHEEGIIHRDIKPSNIMLDKRGRVKVADFGLAKTVNVEQTLLTGTNMALGTPDFIAPEALIPGMKVDQRADIYAVGVMLYQMLTGHIPRGRFELPSGVVPQVDKGFDPIVDKAMQTDREKRYSSATEMKRDVESVVMMKDGSAGTPARTSSSDGGTAAKKAGKSGRAPLLMAAAAVVMLGLSAFFITREPTGQAKVAPPSSSTAKDAAGWSLVDLKAVMLEEAGLTTAPGGWYRMSGMQTYSPFAERMTNAGLRVELGGRLLSGRMPEILLREQETHNYNAFLDGDGQSLVIQRYDGTVPKGHPDHYRTLGSQQLKKPVPSGSPYTLEFVAVGRRLRARINDTTLEVEAPDPPAAGLVTLYNPDFDTFREIEQINLDGLSEAEALKAAGIPASLSTTPAQLLRQWNDATDFVRAAVLKSGMMKQDGEWLEANQKAVFMTLRKESLPGNVAVRIRFANRIEVTMRKTGGAGGGYYALGVGGPFGFITKVTDGKRADVVPSLQLGTGFTDGSEHELIVATHGPSLHLLLDGKSRLTASDASYPDGWSQLAMYADGPGKNSRLRKVEWMSLDGLSEAEALKAAGLSDPVRPQMVQQGWKRVEFPAQGVTDELKSKGGVAMDGALLGVWKDAIFTANSNQPAQNAAVRITAPAAQPAWPVKLVTRLAAGGAWKQYTMHVWPKKAEVARYESGDQVLKTFDLPRPLTEGGDFTAQFASIASDHHVWVNGKFLGSVKDDIHAAPGKLGIQANNGRFKSVETLVLDGLGEAEALKAAGIAFSTPAPAEVPYATLGGDGMIHFPVGGWSWMRTREDQALQREVHAIEKEDAWMRWDERTYGPPAKPPPVGVQNLGVRVWFRGRRVKDWDFPQINLRGIEGQAGPNFHIKYGKLQIRSTASGFPILAEAELREPLTPGKEYLAEFYAIGSRLIARVNGQTVTAGSDVPPVPGYFSIHGADMDWFKDPHVLNLDGLSETEALKAAGITE